MHKDIIVDLRDVAPAQRTAVQPRSSSAEDQECLPLTALAEISRIRNKTGHSALGTSCSISHGTEASTDGDEDDEVPFGHLAEIQRHTSQGLLTTISHGSGMQQAPSQLMMPEDSDAWEADSRYC